jgi:hypothetical protein
MGKLPLWAKITGGMVMAIGLFFGIRYFVLKNKKKELAPPPPPPPAPATESVNQAAAALPVVSEPAPAAMPEEIQDVPKIGQVSPENRFWHSDYFKKFYDLDKWRHRLPILPVMPNIQIQPQPSEGSMVAVFDMVSTTGKKVQVACDFNAVTYRDANNNPTSGYLLRLKNEDGTFGEANKIDLFKPDSDGRFIAQVAGSMLMPVDTSLSFLKKTDENKDAKKPQLQSKEADSPKRRGRGPAKKPKPTNKTKRQKEKIAQPQAQ